MNASNKKVRSMRDGPSTHYLGTAGKDYALYIKQDGAGHLGHVLNGNFYLTYLREYMDVLDFGCGDGALAKVINPYVKKIEGLEVNEFSRKIAKDENGILVFESIAELVDSKKKFDAIISNHVLEHISNPVETLRSLKSVLSTGGVFVTMLPIDDFRRKECSRWKPGDKDRHLQTWTPLNIGNTFDEAGYTPIEIKIINYAWSERFFFLGDGLMQNIVCKALSYFLKSRQLLVVAVNEKAK